MADEIDEIRRRIHIVDLVSQQVHLKRSGKNYTGLCPFHEDKRPSFSVNPDLGRYRCWSCGEAGDIFTWVMKTQNQSFGEALRTLAEQAGVKLTGGPTEESKDLRAQHRAAMEDALRFFRDQLDKHSLAREYCERRGLDLEVLRQWEIGYAPDIDGALTAYLKKNRHSLSESKALFLVDSDPTGGYFDKFRGRLMFPIRNERNELVAFGGRLLGDGIPKYINSSDTPLYRKSRVLYGLDRAKDQVSKTRRLVLVEGYLDVIACHRAGVSNAVASLGTSLSEDHVALIKRWADEVVILYDADNAGQKAADRAMGMLQGQSIKVRISLMPEGEDPDTLLRHAGASAVQAAVEKGLRPTEFQMSQLEKRWSPENDEFWTEAITILAANPHALEVARFVTELAPRFPGIRDAMAAQRHLQKMIENARKEPANANQRLASGPAPITHISMQSAEQAIFLAFLEETTRVEAWEALGESDRFVTRQAADLSRALRDSFVFDPPLDAPNVWLAQIEDESARDLLTDLAFSPNVHRVDQQFLQDSIAALDLAREKRKLQDLKKMENPEERLKTLNNRLRKLKGSP